VGARFITEVSDLDTVTKSLNDRGWTVSKSELGYLPKNTVDLAPDHRKEVEDFLGSIDDDDDVHRIYPAIR
jgi:transcriptional/translational regulatory protein YebC/TACO1